MPKQQRPLRIFLCHASADKLQVRKLYDYLKRRRVRPWFDEVDLEGGQDWQREIPKAISTSDAILICLSKNSVDKEGYVQREIKYALDKALDMPEGRIFIVPVRLEECEVPDSLSRYQWVDLFKQDGDSKLMKSLKVRAQQLERTTIQTPKLGEDDLNLSARSENTLLTLEGGLQKVSSTSSESATHQPGSKINARIVVASIVAITALLAVVFPSPALQRLIASPAEPTLISSPTATATTFVETKPPTPSLTATVTRIPTRTHTPEPGYFIVEPEEALNIGYTLRSLGQMAIEKHPPDELKKMNNTLTYTINSTADVAILWRWFWCAATTRILEQNMEKISILFNADGYLIPEERLAKIVFTNADPALEGWQCQTYQTVLRDWKPGTYKLSHTATFAAPINDGRENFEAGYKTFEYSVHISE